MTPDTQKDIGFEQRHFASFRSLVAEHTGIKISEAKVEMVYRRFAPRIKKLGLNDLGEYCKLLKTNDADELHEFSNLITTNLTSFFRENHHFEYLVNECLPEVIERNSNQRKLRIWSAGCSSGEEPYSIAMVLREMIPNIDKWDARILATDLDTNCLEKGKLGIYSEKSITGISKARLKRFFTKKEVGGKAVAQANPELQSLIAFRHLNLMHDWPFSGTFDVIFCRNVMIYFDKPTQKILIKKFSAHQHPGASLIIGHSENISLVTSDYTLSGQTIYLRN